MTPGKLTAPGERCIMGPMPEGANGRRIKQEHWAFATAVFGGMNNTQAYRMVFPNCSHDSARAAGARLLASVNVQEELSRLREKKAQTIIVAKQEISEARTEIIRDPDATNSDKLTACRDEEKMQGWTAPRAIKEQPPGAILLLYAGPIVSPALPNTSNPPEEVIELPG